MAEAGIPHFHNDPGVKTIRVGAREFMCIGAKPPFDHPHSFIDMGDDTDVICPYCGTHFVYEASLAPHGADPRECLLEVELRGDDLR
jgi:uncharacterized Zn-finger protein